VHIVLTSFLFIPYASGFENAFEYLNANLPRSETIGDALRTEVRPYPAVAIRELLANSLIHQDFSLRGTGPMVEVFSDRVEITNPGIPLIDTNRFIDLPPISRNETTASLMRRCNMCEERGSGIDRVIYLAEAHRLPPPEFEVHNHHTKAILFGPRSLSEMDRPEKIRACYQHACLLWISGQKMTNETLRKRLLISDRNYPMASRVIADTVERGLIKPSGNPKARRFASYLPFWA
jgi:ATP-dependent DNA helicase RecG